MRCNRGNNAAEDIQKFINGYGFSKFDVYPRTDDYLAIDVEGINEDEVASLLNRLHAWNLNVNQWEHYIEIYIGNDDRW